MDTIYNRPEPQRRWNGRCVKCKRKYSTLAHCIGHGKREGYGVYAHVHLFHTPEGRELCGPHMTQIFHRCCCGAWVRLSPVMGKVREDKPCDGRCMGATGHQCECRCGGLNHGASHGL